MSLPRGTPAAHQFATAQWLKIPGLADAKRSSIALNVILYCCHYFVGQANNWVGTVWNREGA